MYKKNKFIKRLIAPLMGLFLLFQACCVSAISENVALDLQSLDIIDTVPYDELELDRTITRAEFAKIVTRLLGYENAESFSTDKCFTDVPEEHWAAGYINLTKAMGIFEGYDGGLFYPDAGITLQEAVKVVVTVLGYKVNAQKVGYPDGYIIEAGNLRLLKGIAAGFTDVALRSDIFQLVYNALDVDRLTLTNPNNFEYEISEGDTIRMLLMSRGNIFEGTGVVTANFEAFLIDSNPAIEMDEVEINGTVYKIGASDAEEYLGVKVDYAAYEDENTGEYTLKYVIPHKDVQMMSINSEEFEKYSNGLIEYYSLEDSRSKRDKISDSAVILYNNRPITDWDQFNIDNGYIRLIDNTADRTYDVVMIYDYVSVPVGSIDIDENFIRLKDSALYNGVSTIVFDLSDNDTRNVAYNAQGDSIRLEDIAEDTLISVFEDANREYMKIVTGTEKVTGVISSIFEEECIIDDEVYKFEVKESLSEDNIQLGDKVTAYLNHEGKVGYLELADDENVPYGYIINTDVSGSGETTVVIATAGKMTKRVDNLDNDPESNNTVTVLVSGNNDVIRLKAAQRCTVVDQYGNSLKITDGSKLPKGQVVKFYTNSSGELAKIVSPQMLDIASDMTYNAKDNVFGKSASTPFGIDDDTVVVCVPENYVDSYDDYLAEVEMEDSQQYNVCGFDFNKNNSNVRLLMIKEEMNFESSAGIGVNTSLAIVKNVSTVLDEEENMAVTQLELLTKELGVELNKTVKVAS